MRRLELLFWSIGVTLLLAFFGMHAWGEITRQHDVARFSSASESSVGESALYFPELSQPLGQEDVLAVLQIPGIGLELPVRYGTGQRVLRQGPGLIEGTALPGTSGNVAIAAHRDLHFRGLKDLEIGDLIKLETLDHSRDYIVTALTVVEPTDVHVLDDIGQPALTLVTCYPFYFVGNAPKRFIVRAEAAEFLH